MSVPNTSGTYNFSPAMGEDGAVRYRAVRHPHDRAHSAALRDRAYGDESHDGRWSARGVNLWQVDLHCPQLHRDARPTRFPSNTIVILGCLYHDELGQFENRSIILPISSIRVFDLSEQAAAGIPHHLLDGPITAADLYTCGRFPMER